MRASTTCHFGQSENGTRRVEKIAKVRNHSRTATYPAIFFEYNFYASISACWGANSDDGVVENKCPPREDFNSYMLKTYFIALFSPKSTNGRHVCTAGHCRMSGIFINSVTLYFIKLFIH
jgi:hypothetical protein